jgi:hypothetical protein
MAAHPNIPEHPNILLLATEAGIQYRVLRCFAALGAKIHVAGPMSARALAISRYCAAFHLFSVGRDGEHNASAAKLDALAREHAIDLVVPSDGITTRYVSRVAALLSVPVFPVPDAVSFEKLATKDQFRLFCKRHGIPHPEGVVFSSRAQLLDALDSNNIRLPAVFKPINRAGGIGVIRVEKKNAIDVATKLTYAPVLVQDYIEGIDLSITVSCTNGAITKQVIYCHPGGAFHFQDRPDLAAMVKGIVKTLSLTGVINFDARLDSKGQIWMIECNPRFFYNMDVSMVAGVNFAQMEKAVPEKPVALPDCRVRIPRALAYALVNLERPNRHDWRLLLHWLRDPLMFLLLSAGYQRRWESSLMERILTWPKFNTSRADRFLWFPRRPHWDARHSERPKDRRRHEPSRPRPWKTGDLYPAEQHQHHNDDQDQTEPAAWVVSPSGAVRPGRQSAEKQQDEHDNQNCAEHETYPLLRRFAEETRWRPRKFLARQLAPIRRHESASR